MLNRKTEQLLTNCITENKQNIYRLAYSYVKNKEDALDIVQDSIYKAMTSIEHLKDESVVRSWFFRIVVNTSLDFLRKHKKIYPMDQEKLELYAHGAVDEYMDIDLVRTLDDLPPKYREVIILRYFEDMKIEEVAEVLHDNVNTVKTRLYQALKLLRVKLKDRRSSND
jgi:RNA polymerase sigma-70 factor (ECF subfamily)